MSLKLLANESLLNFFEYFYGIDLFRVFYGLNSRFDTLLIVHFRTHSFHFKSVSKHDFYLTCRQYLPLITDWIITLHLSNNDESPYQINLFLSNGRTLQHFIHWWSLSFHYIYSNELLFKIVFQCSRLLYLTRLRFIKCLFDYCLKIHYDPMSSLFLKKRRYSVETVYSGVIRRNSSAIYRWAW
jgi:hypothetical protein